MTGWRVWLPFAPSVAMGVVGLTWIALRPIPLGELFAPDRAAWFVAAWTVATAVATAAAAWALERLLPSFRHAGRLLERLLARLDLPVGAILAIAALTAGSEELLFRGALLAEFGIWPQAILFGLLHPAGREGWSYPVFAFGSALALGWLAVVTGTLWAPMAVHFAINLHGLLEARRRSPLRDSPSSGQSR